MTVRYLLAFRGKTCLCSPFLPKQSFTSEKVFIQSVPPERKAQQKEPKARALNQNPWKHAHRQFSSKPSSHSGPIHHNKSRREQPQRLSRNLDRLPLLSTPSARRRQSLNRLLWRIYIIVVQIYFLLIQPLCNVHIISFRHWSHVFFKTTSCPMHL